LSFHRIEIFTYTFTRLSPDTFSCPWLDADPSFPRTGRLKRIKAGSRVDDEGMDGYGQQFFSIFINHYFFSSLDYSTIASLRVYYGLPTIQIFKLDDRSASARSQECRAEISMLHLKYSMRTPANSFGQRDTQTKST